MKSNTEEEEKRNGGGGEGGGEGEEVCHFGRQSTAIPTPLPYLPRTRSLATSYIREVRTNFDFAKGRNLSILF